MKKALFGIVVGIALMVFASLALFNAFKDRVEPSFAGTLPIAGSTYSLAGSGISPSATSITLQSFTIPQTGQLINDSDMSDVFYLTLEPGNRSKQEIVSCTTVAQNAGGTATLSGCTRGLSPISPYTASSTLQFAHGGGTQVIFSDPPQFFNLYTAKANNESITGTYTFASSAPPTYDGAWAVTSSSTSTNIPYVSWVFNNYVDRYNSQSIAGAKTFSGAAVFSATTTLTQGALTSTNYKCTSTSSGLQLCDKDYIDGVAVAGASDAGVTTKGIVEEATAAEIDAGSATGGTGAKLFFTPATFLQSAFASTTASTTQIAQGSQISTTTMLYAGQTALIMVATGPMSANNAYGLYLKPASSATTTLQQTMNCPLGVECYLPLFGTYTASVTENIQIYMATGPSGTPVNTGSGGATNMTILKFSK